MTRSSRVEGQPSARVAALDLDRLANSGDRYCCRLEFRPTGNRAPTAGRALIDGRVAHELSADQRRDAAHVPQDDVLHDDLSVYRMLIYAAGLRQPAGTDARGRTRASAERALEQVELTGVADLAVRQLSGGQRRRASLAIELVTDPRACVLDEPTSGLDPVTAEAIVAELRGLADRGCTVVFATHNPDDLRDCDRIVAVGVGGRIVFDGPPAQAVSLAGSNDTSKVHRLLTSTTTPLTEPRPGPPTLRQGPRSPRAR